MRLRLKKNQDPQDTLCSTPNRQRLILGLESLQVMQYAQSLDRTGILPDGPFGQGLFLSLDGMGQDISNRQIRLTHGLF